MVPLRSLELLRKLTPDFERLREFEERLGVSGCCVFVLRALDLKASVHVRFFAPSVGVHEDPATGSAAGALGAYLVAHKALGSRNPVSFSIEQGLEMRRPSLITVTVHHDQNVPTLVKVSGKAVTVLKGEIIL